MPTHFLFVYDQIGAKHEVVRESPQLTGAYLPKVVAEIRLAAIGKLPEFVVASTRSLHHISTTAGADVPVMV